MVLSPSWMIREVRLTIFLCVCRNWVVDHLSITLFEHVAHVVHGTAGVGCGFDPLMAFEWKSVG